MTEIPADILEAARDVANAVRIYRHNASQWEMVRDAAARAILAERERCAKIADEFAAENWGFTEAEHAGQTLATAIRADTTQERTP